MAEKDDKDGRPRIMRGVKGSLLGSFLGDIGVLGSSRANARSAQPGFPASARGQSLLSMLPERARDVERLDRRKLHKELSRTGAQPSKMNAGEDNKTVFRRGKPPEIELSSPTTASAFHEIGHAVNDGEWGVRLRKHTEHRVHTLFSNSPETPSIGDGLRLGFLAGAIANPSDKHPTMKFVHDNAALLTGLTEMPIIMSELRASYSALKGMHALEGAKGVRGGLKTLLPAFGTYLADSAGRVGGVALARRLARPETKTAAAMPTMGMPKAPAAPKVTGQLRLSSIAANKTPIGQLKPKTTAPHPGNRRGNFPGTPTAKPPSLTGYYKDTMDSMDAPTRGTRT